MHRVHSPPSSVQRGLGGAAAFLQAASKAQTCQQWLLWTKVGGGGEPGQLPAEGRTGAGGGLSLHLLQVQCAASSPQVVALGLPVGPLWALG